MIFFPPDSAELSAQSLSTIWSAGSARIGQRVPAACESFSVVGHIDAAEATRPDSKLDVARADAVRLALEKRGASVVQVEGRSGQESLVKTAPGVAEPQNRRAIISWSRAAKGRVRCDPATRQQAHSAACIGEYGACYVELYDGTICNYDGVPDPNPERYSVVR
jgi:hypothetical protein